MPHNNQCCFGNNQYNETLLSHLGGLITAGFPGALGCGRAGGPPEEPGGGAGAGPGGGLVPTKLGTDGTLVSAPVLEFGAGAFVPVGAVVRTPVFDAFGAVT